MLVHRVVVVHVELHHGDDAAEVGNETPEHASFVHAPQRRLRVLGGAEHLEKDAVGFRVVAQLVVDEAQGPAQQSYRVGMEEGIRLLRPGKEADEVDGIALEDVGVGYVEPAIVDAEIAGRADVAARAPAQGIEQPAEPGGRLDLLHLQRRAQDGREVADVLGDQEVVLHEALDGF